MKSVALATPGVAKLLQRESHWINELKPELNVKGSRGLVNIDELPQGLPENPVATAK